MKPNLVDRFFLDECTTEIRLLLEIQIDEMISGKGPKVREHNFNLYDLRLDATRKKVRIVDIFDPRDSGRLEMEMFHFRTLLKRQAYTSPPARQKKPGQKHPNQKSKRSSRVLDFIAASAKKLSQKKRSFVDASDLLHSGPHSGSHSGTHHGVGGKGGSIKSKILKNKREEYIKVPTDPVLPKKLRSLGLMDAGNKVTLLLEESLPPTSDQSEGRPNHNHSKSLDTKSDNQDLSQSTKSAPPLNQAQTPEQSPVPRRYSVTFRKHLCYRRTDEGNRLRMLATMDPAVLVSSGYGLFQVNYSEFFRWFDQESYNRYEKRSPQHYCFITTQEVYDFLCYQPPEVIAMPAADPASDDISLMDLLS